MSPPQNQIIWPNLPSAGQAGDQSNIYATRSARLQQVPCSQLRGWGQAWPTERSQTWAKCSTNTWAMLVSRVARTQQGAQLVAQCEESWCLPPAPLPRLSSSWCRVETHSQSSPFSRDIWLRQGNTGFHTLVYSSSGGRTLKQVQKLKHDYVSAKKK